MGPFGLESPPQTQSLEASAAPLPPHATGKICGISDSAPDLDCISSHAFSSLSGSSVPGFVLSAGDPEPRQTEPSL